MDNDIISTLFRHKKVIPDKLISYGFVLNSDKYTLETILSSTGLRLMVTIYNENTVSTKIIDSDSNEEYVLHLIPTSVGEYVGKVREEYETVLTDIADKCFEKNVFKSPQSREIINAIRKRYGDELEFLWEKFDDNAIWRRKDNRKWYGLLLTVNRRKLGLPQDEKVEILDIRIDPEISSRIIDNKRYFPAYHMNKHSWMTIIMDYSIPTETIMDLIETSYQLANKK